LKEDRLSTGVKELDNLIDGGIPRGYLILLAGNPGSGKTIFAAQYLYAGLKTGEHGVYASFAEDQRTFSVNMKKLHEKVDGAMKWNESERFGFTEYVARAKRVFQEKSTIKTVEELVECGVTEAEI
jgi:circadian clock protein KaiC